MRIEEELKLDYSDVLFRPKRSTLKSRKDVNLLRTYRFKYSKNEWSGIPIMAANMDGVGTFEMAYTLSHYKLFTCLTKQNSPKDWHNQFQADRNYVAVSTGTNKAEYELVKEIVRSNNLRWICIDIANGYSEHFADFVKIVRNDFPNINISPKKI